MKRDSLGRFVKGQHYSIDTEFKKGQHWRSHKPYWDKEWLIMEYVDKRKSAVEIAKENNCTFQNICYWLDKHGIKRRTTKEIRAEKNWGLKGNLNGMYGACGKLNPNWRGGCTPERQSFYMSHEWKNVCSKVYKRDNAKCVRCGSTKDLHIHHIESFSNKEKRSSLDNLVLLCKVCHHFVHSKKNVNKEYIRNTVKLEDADQKYDRNL